MEPTGLQEVEEASMQITDLSVSLCPEIMESNLKQVNKAGPLVYNLMSSHHTALTAWSDGGYGPNVEGLPSELRDSGLGPSLFIKQATWLGMQCTEFVAFWIVQRVHKLKVIWPDSICGRHETLKRTFICHHSLQVVADGDSHWQNPNSSPDF